MIYTFHAYSNHRANVDWNTCGQAAIASVADYWGRNPYGLPRRGWHTHNYRYYWDDGEAIDATKAGGYGPDVIFGWGTTPGSIRNALTSYGLAASVGHSGIFSWGWQELWASVQNYLYWNRPVPVLIDLGAIGGPGWSPHWAVAYRVDGGRIYLGNCPWNPAPVVSSFQNAWHCWYLPYGFNHAAVFC
jgi:hypothetical protein